MTYNFEQAKQIVEKYKHLADGEKSFLDSTNRMKGIGGVIMVPDDKEKRRKFFSFYNQNKDNLKSIEYSGWKEDELLNVIVYHFDTYDRIEKYVQLEAHLNYTGQGDIVIP
jgi:hypothetical protein